MRNPIRSVAFFVFGVIAVHGRRFALLDLYTPSLDGEIRNIMVATSFEGRLLVVTFNCTRKLDAQWGEVGVGIMESLVVIDQRPV